MMQDDTYFSESEGWTFGGNWDIEPGNSSIDPIEFPCKSLVQVIKQVYVMKSSATIVKGYVEIFLGDQLIIKMDCTSTYHCIFEPKTIGEVEFIMKWSDDCEMQIHYLDIAPLEKDDLTMEELIN